MYDSNIINETILGLLYDTVEPLVSSCVVII